MAQALCRQRLKIVPVVYALSTLCQNVEFSTTLKSEVGNERARVWLLFAQVSTSLSLCVLSDNSTHATDRTGTKGSKGRNAVVFVLD